MSGPSIPGLGPGYRLTVEDAAAETDVEVLPHALETYNEGRWPQHPPWQPLAIFVRDEAQIVAGLAGGTYCGWLFVKYLWVSDGLRGRGIGRELMAQAETRARELLTRHIEALHLLTSALLEQETITGDQVRALLHVTSPAPLPATPGAIAAPAQPARRTHASTKEISR